MRINKNYKKQFNQGNYMKVFYVNTFLFFVILSFSCQKQSVETSIKEKKPQVKIDLVFEKEFPIMPIKIILDGEEGDYIKKIQKDKFNYSFYDLKPGKCFVGFIFLEEIGGKKYEFQYSSSMIVDGDNAKTEQNEIKVYKKRPVEIKLVLSPSFYCSKRNEIEKKIFNRYGRSYGFYKQKFIKEKKRDYYEIHFNVDIYKEEK
ncbi:MAG: hypothetical protein KAT34_16540 [Candidatus Aminicenantes bacterium]|nr:hypothetical protein [Candidatus Aminicenantes bacterium]